MPPAVDLVERTVIPALEVSATLGVASRTLANSYWVVAFNLFDLESKHPPNDGGVGAATVNLVRRLLRAAAALDDEDIRFPRSLAVSYGKTQSWQQMNQALADALVIDSTDAEASQMATWAAQNTEMTGWTLQKREIKKRKGKKKTKGDL